jgi:hypothetical protein
MIRLWSADHGPDHGPDQGPNGDRRSPEEAERVRRFTDRAGYAWRVRRFTPTGAASTLSPDHARGWLTFVRDDGERRRLVPAPDDWETMPEDALRYALDAARQVARADAIRDRLEMDDSNEVP